ncbi:hypothetical protein RBU60_02965 [Mesonia sp. MT50]|uniref:Lipoprotein n=1 Tax=Mesonia profundi TaxID=3070998 RepID=A0ABU0ZYI1_9FLAO|nr:hypothetical protein [Mesonia profundi]MDQ7916522.1 hypothetical protein [Mesonia profundi]
MKKFLIIISGFLILSSCISIHKAERIENYKLSTKKINQVDLTSYVIQYSGNGMRHFENMYQRFFDVEDHFSIYELETTSLFGSEKFKVFSHFDQDYDKSLSIFDVIDSAQESKKTQQEKDRDKPYKDRREEQDRKNNKVEYVYIQIMGEDGQDILAEKSMRKDAILQKLHQLRKQLNR